MSKPREKTIIDDIVAAVREMKLEMPDEPEENLVEDVIQQLEKDVLAYVHDEVMAKLGGA